MQKEYCKSLPVENRRTRFWEKMFPQRGSDGHSTALHLHGRRTRPHQNYCSGIVAATQSSPGQPHHSDVQHSTSTQRIFPSSSSPEAHSLSSAFIVGPSSSPRVAVLTPESAPVHPLEIVGEDPILTTDFLIWKSGLQTGEANTHPHHHCTPPGTQNSRVIRNPAMT